MLSVIVSLCNMLRLRIGWLPLVRNECIASFLLFSVQTLY